MIKTLAVAAAVLATWPAHARCRGGETVSWYEEPQRVASGGRLDPRAMTCAHRKAPFGTVLDLVDLDTGRRSHCTVNDRGPNVSTGCVVDVTPAVARELGIVGKGIGRVAVTARGRS